MCPVVLCNVDLFYISSALILVPTTGVRGSVFVDDSLTGLTATIRISERRDMSTHETVKANEPMAENKGINIL